MKAVNTHKDWEDYKDSLSYGNRNYNHAPPQKEGKLVDPKNEDKVEYLWKLP